MRWVVACGTPASTEKYIKIQLNSTSNTTHIPYRYKELHVPAETCSCFIYKVYMLFLADCKLIFILVSKIKRGRNTYKTFWYQIWAWDHLKNLRVERRMLKRTLKEQDGKVWSRFMWLRIWRAFVKMMANTRFSWSSGNFLTLSEAINFV
jgi:hypothetical protein